MPNWLVREYMDGTPWEDARRHTAGDAQDAAKAFAEWQCSRDSDYYRSYESGRVLEVRQDCNPPLTTSTLVSVCVSFDPSFSSRIDRTLTECNHPRISEARVLVSRTLSESRQCPDCQEIVFIKKEPET